MKRHMVAASAALWALAGCSGQAGPAGGFAVQVVVEKARLDSISETIPLVGTLAANEAIELKSEVDGKVEDIRFREGERVEKGRVLFVIEGAKLAAQVGQAEAEFKLSEANLKRSEALLKDATISRQEYDQAVSRYESDKAELELAREAFRDATVRAPFDGAVGARMVSPGQVVAKGDKLSTLVDADPLKAEFNVPERYAGQLKKGLEVNVKVASHPGETFRGEVYFVSPEIDPVTRTALVKAQIPNKGRKLSPGLFANLELRLSEVENAVVVPESALLQQADQVQLYVVGAENKADLRSVKTGARTGGRVQILEGVQAGENVIAEGHQKIGPGSPVTFDAGTSTGTAKP